jgi:two-component system, chemotaxis family, protein-glutamate methylesterase/glutaminase
MHNRDIIVVGASAGGVEALQKLAASLPEHLEAAVFISVHFPEGGTSVLPRILSRAGALPAQHARNGEQIQPGRIYVAPPDHHLLLTGAGLRIVRGPKENGNRPAIDPMFRSAALAFGPRVIGVVLTGNLDDGTSGLAAIKRHGGATVVQDPDDALFPSMPQSAITHVDVDCVVPLSSIADTLLELMDQPVDTAEYSPMPDDVKENALSAGDLGAIEDAEHHPGTLSAFGCPDCGGVLWELREGDFTRFRCRVGHAWTGDALVAEQSTTVDEALWVALRALEENAALYRQMAKRHESRGLAELASRCTVQAELAEGHATIVRESLLRERGFSHDEPAIQSVERIAGNS